MYLFYQLVLRKLTFYNWNRWFLLGYSMLAFFIPFINISPALQQVKLVNNKVVQFIPVMEKFTTTEKVSMDQWDWALLCFATGFILLLVRLIIQHISFLRLRRTATLILKTPVKLFQTEKKIIPFSFWGSIYLSPQQHTEKELDEIIRHEMVHVKQRHSLDMFWAELLCILNWYNPFAWLIRHAIRQNLEFIADNEVVKNGIDKKQYQYLLLKVIGSSQYSIGTYFNFTSLKKRIAMLNKMKSAKVHLVKFIFVLPLIVVMLLAFRNKIQYQDNNVLRGQGVLDTIPKNPTPVSAPGLPKNVTSITSSNNVVTVILKNSTKERYNFSKPAEQAAFEKKYGAMPSPPEPPAAPAAPEAPEPSLNSTINDIPAPPLPPVVNSAGLPNNVSSIHIYNKQATIKLKNGTVEKYDLSKPDEKAACEKKYGNISPTAPSAPNPTPAPVISPNRNTASLPEIDVTPVVSPEVVTGTAAVIDIMPPMHNLSGARKEELIAEISNQATPEKIDELKKQLLEKGYPFSVGSINFKDGLLQSIEGTIADENSKSRFVADNFSKIIITKITYKNGKTGFNVRILDGSIRM